MMKKYIALLLILLLFCSTGCTRSQPKVERGEPISFEGLPVYESGVIRDYISYTHLSEITEKFTLTGRVVFRGKKDGLSVPITTYREDGTKDWSYCETPIRVLEVFYGDLQAGDLVIHDEMVEIATQGEKTCLFLDPSLSPIAENEEYIFIFSVHKRETPVQGTRYGSISVHHSYHKIADYELYKQKVADGTATYRENFGFEVMDYYLNQPDTQLDLRQEASKYVEDLPKDATQEEILAALPKEHQDLFDRMIKKYGVKNHTADDKIPGVDEPTVSVTE